MKHFKRILNRDILKLNDNEISSSGYVIDALEASLWSFLTTGSFDDAVLKAVNLGGDTDTIGAITGGLAGVYYGFDTINKNWLNAIIKKNEIMELIRQYYKKIELGWR